MQRYTFRYEALDNSSRLHEIPFSAETDSEAIDWAYGYMDRLEEDIVTVGDWEVRDAQGRRVYRDPLN